MDKSRIAEWRTALSDRQILDAVLEFIEARIDEASEQTKIDSVESLSSARRALAMMSRVWGEVENGGLPQFFYNKPDVRWRAWAIEAARMMDMPGTRAALEAGDEIMREFLPTLERGQLEWTEFCDLVWEPFEARCGSTFYDDELEDFERRGAAFIRSDPDLSALAPEALETHGDEPGETDTELVLTDRERELLFTAGTLVPYLDEFTPKDSPQAFTFKQSANGTIKLKYRYIGTRADGAPGLLIFCKVGIHPTESDAAHACEASARSVEDAHDSDVDPTDEVEDSNLDPTDYVEERNEFFQWGDQSYYYAIFQAGEPSGFSFDARSGRKCFSLTIYDLRFEDTDAIAEALGPALDRLLAYEPRQPFVP